MLIFSHYYLEYFYRIIIKYKNTTSNNVAIAKTIKNLFVSFASLTLLDALAAAGDLVAVVDGCDFFLLIILVFEKIESLI
jgi:hypothetical protein